MVSGGTLLMVHGSHFMQSCNAYCQFGGGLSSLARWLSSNLMECYSPASTNEGYVQLQLSINDQDVSHEHVLLEYQHMAHVQHILPNKGGWRVAAC